MDLMSMSRWASFVQKVKAHWRSWIAIKFSFNLLLFSLELWYNRRIQVVAFSKKMILLNRVISVLLSGIYFTLPSRLSRFLALPWDVSNISFDSDSPFTYWGCEELRSLLINATVIQISRQFTSCDPVCNVVR